QLRHLRQGRNVLDLVAAQVQRRQLRQVAQRRDVADLVAGQVQRRQAAQPLQGVHLGELVAGQLQVLKLGEAGERRHIGDLVLGEVERLEVGQALERRQVADLVVGQLEQRQVGALLQAGQVLDVLAGRLEDEEVAQALVGQLRLGVAQDGPDRGLQVLVGERPGGGLPGPGEGQAEREEGDGEGAQAEACHGWLLQTGNRVQGTGYGRWAVEASPRPACPSAVPCPPGPVSYLRALLRKWILRIFRSADTSSRMIWASLGTSSYLMSLPSSLISVSSSMT